SLRGAAPFRCALQRLSCRGADKTVRYRRLGRGTKNAHPRHSANRAALPCTRKDEHGQRQNIQTVLTEDSCRPPMFSSSSKKKASSSSTCGSPIREVRNST